MNVTAAIPHFVSHVLAAAIFIAVGYEVAVANTSFVPGTIGAYGCMCPVTGNASGTGIAPFLVFIFIASLIGVGWFSHSILANPDE